MSEISLDAIEELEGILDKKASSTANDGGTARVTRVDADGTAWVHVFGGAGETPLRAYGSALEPGDVVEVRQAANGLYAAGNYSDPAAGVRRVGAVEDAAQDARKASRMAVEGAAAARQVADEAQKVAEATNQHFWDDDNGAHVTDVTRDEWAAAVEDNFSDYDPDSKPYHNQLLNSLGILLRTALNNLVSITRSAIAFYDGAGNAAGNIVARFGADGAQIGKSDESHMELDYHSMQMVDRDGNTYFHVSDLRDASGYATLVEVIDNPDDGTYEIPVAFPPRSVGTTSVVIYPDDPDERAATVVSVQETQDGRGIVTVEEEMQEFVPVQVTYQTDADSAKAFTFGTRASGAAVGGGSFAAGSNVTASGTMAQAFGRWTDAQGEFSHAEGVSTGTSGRAGHVEGSESIAPGDYAHGEGLHGWATGRCSHAQNNYTVAASADQTAMGRYNVEDANNAYALIIGNGTAEDARSNALAVTWDGSTIAQGWAGVIQMFAGSTPPNGWLICDGSAVSRTTYAVLFAAIGTTWGAGDGSTTFNIPDLRGRAPIGAGAGSGLTARTLGGTVGEETHTLTIDEMPNHGHKSHYYTASGRSGDGMQYGSKYATSQDTESGSMIARTGGDGAHNNMQPSAVVNFIIHTGKF